MSGQREPKNRCVRRRIAAAALIVACLAAPRAASAGSPLRAAAAAVRADTFAVAQAPSSGPSSNAADVPLGITSLSASSVAIGLTAACVSDGTCREVNPVMRKWLGDSRTGAIVGKAAIGGAIHYAVYRLVRKGKPRTIALAALAAFNVYDAVNDIRVMRRIDGRRPAN